MSITRIGEPPAYRPGFCSGYARSAGEAAFPQYWQDYVGGIAPLLGEQGINLLDPGGQDHPGAVNESTLNYLQSPFGPALGNDTTPSGGHLRWSGQASGTKWKTLAPPFTLLWYGKWKQGHASDTVHIFQTDPLTTFTNFRRGFTLLIDDRVSSQRVFLIAGDAAGAETQVASPEGLPAEDVWQSIAVRCLAEPLSGTLANDTVQMFIDGQSQEIEDNGGSALAVHANNTFSNLGASGAGDGSLLYTALFSAYARALSDEEILLWSMYPPIQFVPIAAWPRFALWEPMVSGPLGNRPPRRTPLSRPRGPARRTIVDTPAPVIYVPRRRMGRKGRRDKGTKGRRGGIGPMSSGMGGVAAGVALVRRRAQVRTTWNIFAAAEYRFYHSTTGPPEEGSVPFATNASLAFSPPDLFGNGTHWFSVSYFNGLFDSGFLPVGPSGETAYRIDISGGVVINSPPNAPNDFRLELRDGGRVLVTATYAQDDGLRATEFAITYTTDGSTPGTPPAVSPTVTVAMSATGLAVLEHMLGPFAHGTTIKARVQSRRNDGSWVYSEGSTVLTAVADATGPTAAVDADPFPGGV